MTSDRRTRAVICRITIALAMIGATLSVGWGTAASAHTPKKQWKQKKHVKVRARNQIGAPYSYGGSSPAGFDCSGFTSWVFNGHGASLPHSAASQFALAAEGDHLRIRKRKNLKAGDLVFFDTTSANVGHAGIYLSKGKFISATSSSGVRVDSITDPYYWGPRYVGATRVPQLRKALRTHSTGR